MKTFKTTVAMFAIASYLHGFLYMPYKKAISKQKQIQINAFIFQYMNTFPLTSFLPPFYLNVYHF